MRNNSSLRPPTLIPSIPLTFNHILTSRWYITHMTKQARSSPTHKGSQQCPQSRPWTDGPSPSLTPSSRFRSMIPLTRHGPIIAGYLWAFGQLLSLPMEKWERVWTEVLSSFHGWFGWRQPSDGYAHTNSPFHREQLLSKKTGRSCRGRHINRWFLQFQGLKGITFF